MTEHEQFAINEKRCKCGQFHIGDKDFDSISDLDCYFEEMQSRETQW